MKQRGRKSAAQREVNAIIQSRTKRDRVVIDHDTPQPPSHLSPVMQAWWTEVVANHELQPHQLFVLQCACEAFDAKEQARKTLLKLGTVYEDAKGTLKPRPETIIERDSRAAFARLVRELGLAVEQSKVKQKPVGGFGITDAQLRGWNGADD
jgi:P27 family predicted phage terminase small subunit